MQALDFGEAPDRVRIDISGTHIWAISSVAALDMAVLEDLAALDARSAMLTQVRSRAILEDAMTTLDPEGVAPEIQRLRRGDLPEALAELEPDTRATVVGKPGEAAAFAAGHVVSNREGIVRARRVPVLVASRAFRPIARVLVAFDASSSAEVAIERMAATPVVRDLPVTLVHAGETGTDPLSRVEGARDRLRAAGRAAETRVAPGECEQVARAARPRTPTPAWPRPGGGVHRADAGSPLAVTLLPALSAGHAAGPARGLG